MISKSILPLGVLSVIVLSLFSMLPFQKADALSAATFADKPTFTDTGLSEYWQTVYTIRNGTSTYFVDSNSTHIKAVRIDTSGNILSTTTATLPAGGVSHVSQVEETGSQFRVFFAQLSSGTSAFVGYANLVTGAVTSAGVTLTDTGETPVEVVTTANRVYYLWCCTANTFDSSYTDRALTGFTWQANVAFSTDATTKPVVMCETMTDGASAATDLIYCVNEENTEIFGVLKNLGGTWSDKGNIGSGTTTEVLGSAVGGTLFIARASTASLENLATITVSSDTLTANLFSDDWTTAPTQLNDFDGTTRTWKNATYKSYMANSAKAIAWDGSATALNPDELYLETVNNGTGVLTAIDDTKYYRLSDTLVVSGSGSTWTPRTITTANVIQPTPYEEFLNVPLQVGNYSMLKDSDLVTISCDANYVWDYASAYNTGNDDDCTQWQILDSVGNTIGRELTYTPTSSLVHAGDYTLYNIHVSLATGDATEYYARVSYQGIPVDINFFDATDNVQLRLLYGQCYVLEYIKILDSSVADSSTICADDVAFKEDIINTELGFTFWSAPWGASHSYNSTSHILTTIVHHVPVGYNYTVNIINGTGDIIVTQAYTNVTTEIDNNDFNVTSYLNQTALRVEYINEDGRLFYNQYFETGGDWLVSIRDAFETNIGDFEGWGLLMFLPIIFAAIFTRNTAGIGGGMVVAFIGVIVVFGVIQLPDNVIWLIAFVAVIGILAYRVVFQ